MEEVIKFGGGMTDSFVTPISLAALIVTVLLMFVLVRKGMIIVILLFAILIPVGQQFYIGGVHLFIHRIVILVGLIRLLLSKENAQKHRLAGGWNAIDTSFSLYVSIFGIAMRMQ